jgi:hypothetical protein
MFRHLLLAPVWSYRLGFNYFSLYEIMQCYEWHLKNTSLDLSTREAVGTTFTGNVGKQLPTDAACSPRRTESLTHDSVLTRRYDVQVIRFW